MLKYFLSFVGTLWILGFSALSTEIQEKNSFPEEKKAPASQKTFFPQLTIDAEKRLTFYLSQKDLLNMRLVSTHWDHLIGKIWEERPLKFEEWGPREGGSILLRIIKKKVFHDKDYEFLAQSSFVGVDLIEVNITLRQLRTLGGSTRLVNLSLINNALTPEGAKILSQEGFFPSLKILWLKKNNIGKEGASYLAQGTFPSLQELELGSNGIENEGAIALSRGKFPVLKVLLLWHNEIKNEGAIALIQSPLPALNLLGLWANEIQDPVSNTPFKNRFPTAADRGVLEKFAGPQGLRENLRVLF